MVEVSCVDVDEWYGLFALQASSWERLMDLAVVVIVQASYPEPHQQVFSMSSAICKHHII